MRQGSGARRGRGRGNNSNRKPNRNQSFDSNGPSVRIRGTAAQLQEKYLSLARDASSAGDRVMAENYFQHADHYYRILASQQAPQDGQPPQQQQPYQQQSDRNDDADDDFGNESQSYSGNSNGNNNGDGREPRRAQSGPIRDTDPRARAGNASDGQPPLDEGLHRMLGGDSPASSDSGDEERPARSRRSAAADGDASAEDAPAPRRRRRKAAPEPDTDGENESPAVDAAE